VFVESGGGYMLSWLILAGSCRSMLFKKYERVWVVCCVWGERSVSERT